jgi:hypothetical protein
VNKVEKSLRKPGIRNIESRLFSFVRGKGSLKEEPNLLVDIASVYQDEHYPATPGK